ncbi:CaiB/BaiF CoA transferase family protein [Hydrogenophaga palleronii]|uniref:CaiB/BaiF CoA transferase family protein n=1 Tax=Hydrogenophaga palleronii TaxID=65655 RepID=UPI000824F428|nr:CaiB/BaiF CoA-transferase family protein [Hydrogenophaga palleronii]
MGPLTGYRVLEFASIGPIPLCGMLLADLGAEVIRIDRTGDTDLGVRRDPAFEYTGRGKRSIAVNLKHAEGVQTLLGLVKQADVLIEGFRPGVMERLGLGPDVCLATQPRLVYGRLTGWGQQGPLSSAAGHDMNFLAVTGALDAIGTRGGPPVAPLNLVGDFAGGSLFLALGIAAALASPQDRGRGQVIDAAITDGVSAMMASIHGQVEAGTWPTGRGEHLIGGGAPWNAAYETADGLYVTVCPIEQRFFDILLDKLEIDPATMPDRMDRAHWPAWQQRFEAVFRSRTRAAWRDLLEGTDACFAPVLSAAEARAHPQATRRQMFVVHEGKTQPAPAPRFSGTPATLGSPPVLRAGQHSLEVLQSCEFSAAEIDRLLASGAVVETAAPT